MSTLAREAGDYINLGGRRLDFSDVLNHELMSDKSVAQLSETLRNNSPYPHLVVDGLFSPILLEEMNAEFDRLKWNNWRSIQGREEVKRGTLPNTRFGLATDLYFQTIYSGVFVDFVKRLTRVDGLIGDPELYNGGLHEIPSGGFFKLHTDFTHHPTTGLNNRLVVITYLNEGWKYDYGGRLELWDPDLQQRVQEVVPVMGRTIFLFQTRRSLHGHPNPVTAPDGRTRRSAAAYFYSNGIKDGDETMSLKTEFFNGESRSFRTENERFRSQQRVRQFVPPIVFELVRQFRRQNV
ncbi:2OG-Fe(II) oxygenase [Asticcacaulis sp. AND118]|uniref:2OG-Fe(II) oxygenase n=1 Tax=Asticcacaulis sp. AND118 TaxID=2840468 RepID=UPI001CFFB4E3|nr:2OG-Fe(II) oxygenase [Asticcacaulis sp. AND118]UDF05055.1 2OG-Fe(II) oxygenase [Asticcacaulis sp. AND118]